MNVSIIANDWWVTALLITLLWNWGQTNTVCFLHCIIGQVVLFNWCSYFDWYGIEWFLWQHSHISFAMWVVIVHICCAGTICLGTCLVILVQSHFSQKTVVSLQLAPAETLYIYRYSKFVFSIVLVPWRNKYSQKGTSFGAFYFI